MKKPFLYATGFSVGVCLVLAACAPTSPGLDSRFGESTRATIAQQTIHPEAATQNVPESLDAMAGRESVERYRSSFREPPPASDGFTIGLGSGRSR